jgi:hypothetical protein
MISYNDTIVNSAMDKHLLTAKRWIDPVHPANPVGRKGLLRDLCVSVVKSNGCWAKEVPRARKAVKESAYIHSPVAAGRPMRYGMRPRE